MDYLIILVMVLIVLRQWLNRRQIKQLNSKHKSKILLYSATWCARCQKIKSILDKQMATYVVIDINHSKDAIDELESLGCRALPVLIINGKLVKGFKPLKTERLVQRSQCV